jgi:hypothetical protein
MWHPAGGARQYEAAGSRTSYSDKWHTNDRHAFTRPLSEALHLMIETLNDQEKVRWLNGFEASAVMNDKWKVSGGSYRQYI